jgi:ribokinase
MGENGCLIYSQNIDNAIHIPAYKIKDVIDVTGAGDAFIAGFLAGYIRGYSIEKCGQMGNELASKVIQKIGAV